ncbi:MAG: hypothetical protein PHF50_00305 [Patescibacteria group bacterium]|nr:hypothetical protein [Patescibacteria group bacterium]
MKIRTFAVSIMVLALALATTGCVRAIVKDVNPRVIGSDIDATVERNKANKEKYTTAINAESLKRSRAAERHLVALAEIKGLSTSETGKGGKVLTADGILGGFPAIIINDSACAVSGKITQIGGDYGGTTWSFDVKANGGIKEMKLESRNYAIKWSYPPSAINHPLPGEGDSVLTVHDIVKYIDDRTKAQYHGGYKIKGRSCY